MLVLEAGRSDFRIDPFIHMPAALPYPIGNRLYDWKYESEPEPFMDGRRVYHARGKVLGGSSSINGMIFQRGNPLDYERWAADPGMEQWDYAHCLPYFKRMETCLAGADAAGAVASGPLVLERGPATGPLFGAFFEAAQQAGYPLTDDVNGYRQEGFAPFDRNVYRGRRLWPPVRTCTRCAAGRTSASRRSRRSPGCGPRAPGSPASTTSGPAGCTAASGPARSSSAAARSTARSCCCCQGSVPPRSSSSSGSRSSPTCRGSAGTSRTTSRSTSSTAPSAGLDRAVAQAPPQAPHRRRVAVPAPRGRGDQPLRGRRLHPQQRGRRLAEPDVPLPADRHPVRRVAARRRPRLPGAYRADVLRRPRLADPKSRDPFEHPALRFNYLSTEADRREWIEMVRAARNILDQPAFAAFNAGELSPGPSVETDQEILDWVARDAETALHPSCTAARHGRSTTLAGGGPDLDGGPRRQRVCGWWTPRCSPTCPTATSTPR